MQLVLLVLIVDALRFSHDFPVFCPGGNWLFAVPALDACNSPPMPMGMDPACALLGQSKMAKWQNGNWPRD